MLYSFQYILIRIGIPKPHPLTAFQACRSFLFTTHPFSQRFVFCKKLTVFVNICQQVLIFVNILRIFGTSGTVPTSGSAYVICNMPMYMYIYKYIYIYISFLCLQAPPMLPHSCCCLSFNITYGYQADVGVSIGFAAQFGCGMHVSKPDLVIFYI